MASVGSATGIVVVVSSGCLASVWVSGFASAASFGLVSVFGLVSFATGFSFLREVLPRASPFPLEICCRPRWDLEIWLIVGKIALGSSKF